MSRYAKNTSVPVERTRGEIEREIVRYGADQFVYGWSDSGDAMVGFRYEGRMIRFNVVVPTADGFTRTPTGLKRAKSQVEAEVAKATRQRWRALLLLVKAKLEAVESGITTFEDEFLANTITPDGQTFGDWARVHLDNAIEAGEMPKLLPAMTGGSDD